MWGGGRTLWPIFRRSPREIWKTAWSIDQGNQSPGRDCNRKRTKLEGGGKIRMNWN